jgi:hypothetical protein
VKRRVSFVDQKNDWPYKNNIKKKNEEATDHIGCLIVERLKEINLWI